MKKLMIGNSKILAILLAFAAAVTVCAEYEVLWSDTFSFDTNQSSPVDVKIDDAITCSTAWIAGSGREAVVTAEGVSSGDTYEIARLYDDNRVSSNCWDYFIANADPGEDYIITHTVTSGGQVIDEESVRVRLASSLEDEASWSGNFSLDTVGTAPGTTLTLLTTDDIVYDARWAEGEDRVIKVSAVSNESPGQEYPLYESETDEHGTFRWNYLSEDVPSTVTYTLYYEITGSGVITMGSANPTIRILPEPAFICALFALASLCALRKRQMPTER